MKAGLEAVATKNILENVALHGDLERLTEEVERANSEPGYVPQLEPVNESVRVLYEQVQELAKKNNYSPKSGENSNLYILKRVLNTCKGALSSTIKGVHNMTRQFNLNMLGAAIPFIVMGAALYFSPPPVYDTNISFCKTHPKSGREYRIVTVNTPDGKKEYEVPEEYYQDFKENKGDLSARYGCKINNDAFGCGCTTADGNKDGFIDRTEYDSFYAGYGKYSLAVNPPKRLKDVSSDELRGR